MRPGHRYRRALVAGTSGRRRMKVCRRWSAEVAQSGRLYSKCREALVGREPDRARVALGNWLYRALDSEVDTELA